MATPGVSFRLATPADLDDVIALIRKHESESKEGELPIDWHSGFLGHAVMALLHGKENYAVIVAEKTAQKEKALIGAVSLYLPGTDKAAGLHHILLDSPHRRNAYPLLKRERIDLLLDFARKFGYSNAYTYVANNAQVRKHFNSIGFTRKRGKPNERYCQMRIKL